MLDLFEIQPCNFYFDHQGQNAKIILKVHCIWLISMSISIFSSISTYLRLQLSILKASRVPLIITAIVLYKLYNNTYKEARGYSYNISSLWEF